MSSVVAERGDPAVIHEDGHAEDLRMLTGYLLEFFAALDGEVRYDAIDLHGSSQTQTVLTATLAGTTISNPRRLYVLKLGGGRADFNV